MHGELQMFKHFVDFASLLGWAMSRRDGVGARVHASRRVRKLGPLGLAVGFAVVELEDAAEPRTAHDRACADRRRLGRDELVAQPWCGRSS